MNRESIIDKIRQAGVIGAGGAGFPTYKKLESQVEHVIANGAECEPLMYKDREGLVHDAERLIRGMELMREITDAETVTLAVKEKNRNILSKYRSAQNGNHLSTFVYPDVYPAGDEFVLVYEITGKRIPPGGIPLQIGCVVDNTETIINIARAIDGEPVTGKYITITGAVHNPITTIVPVGTSFRDCIEAAGGLTIDDPVVLTSGVMMGGMETDLSAPVSKSNGGLIVLPSDHYLVRRKTAPQETYTRIGHGQCDQCSLCTELCPRYLIGYPIEPHRVMRTLLMTGEAKERGSMWAEHCCECNICSLIACPEELDPKNICVDAKQTLKENQIGFSKEETERLFRDVHPVRKGREVPISTVYRRLGLLPYDRNAPFAENAVRPDEVIIPLDTHIGQPCQPIVKVGDQVQKGEKIGDIEDGALGAPVHASIEGRITMIEKRGIHIKTN